MEVRVRGMLESGCWVIQRRGVLKALVESRQKDKRC